MDRPEQAERGGEQLADLIELQLLTGSASLSAARARQLVHEQAGASDSSADFAMNVMDRRQRLLGAAYPFRVSAVGLQRFEGRIAQPYATMLIQSTRRAPFHACDAAFAAAAEEFEHLAAAATAALLGPGAEAVRFAWPSSEGRPQAFPDAVRWLAQRMGVPLGTGYRPPRRKDGGVDVVAWRTFGDGQPGFPILLAQCTLERDHIHKSTDIDLRVWAAWLAFDNDPMTALAIPYTVDKREDWLEMAARVIVLDRIRLAMLIPVDTQVATTWTLDQITQLRQEEA